MQFTASVSFYSNLVYTIPIFTFCRNAVSGQAAIIADDQLKVASHTACCINVKHIAY